MFGLSFLNAGILFVAMSAIIPLLIHLFVKTKPQNLYFSSLKYLREVLEERRKRMTINQIILLILRILIILFAIMAIARPVVKLPFINTNNYHPPTAIAYILDTSPSMDYVVSQKNLIQQGVEMIKRIQDQVTPKDISLLLTSNNIWNTTKSKLSHTQITEKELNSFVFTWTPESLEKLIIKAQDELNKSEFLYKEIFVITDMQETKLPKKIDIPVSFIPVFKDTMRINLACESASIKKDFIDGELQRIISFEIVNYSPIIQKDRVVRLILNDNTVSEKMIDLNPFEKKSDSFMITNENPEWNYGWIEVKNEQFIPDNKYYFTFYSDPNPKIAVITDNISLPKQIEIISDIFIGDNGSIEYLTEENLQLADKDKYHYIIFYLNNFSLRTQAFIEELKNSKHKSLFLLSKDMNQDAIDFLSSEYDVIFKSKNFELENISNYNKLHKITGDFDFKTNNSILIKPALNVITKGKISQLINTKNTPVIFESEDIFINIDFSAQEQNFLSYPSFPVILYRCLSWISKYDNILNDYRINDSIQQRNAIITNPDNESFQSELSTYYFDRPGIWTIEKDSVKKYFAVNMSDFSEQSKHNPMLLLDNPQYKIMENEYKKTAFQQDSGTEMWKLLLWFALIFIIIEMIIVLLLQKKAKV
ncbi:MAG: BatA domain-containing protein [Candidatus Cloacimonetes bacterium]|nr:BatA domain-containing protein [Candidatus Cloacimonadota bacterium]MDD4155088.1 BatA domain-containing protein [Candidatus Cloacimonadota bacterium]